MYARPQDAAREMKRCLSNLTLRCKEGFLIMSMFRKFGINRPTLCRHQDVKVKQPGIIKLEGRRSVCTVPEHFEDEPTSHVVDRHRPTRFFDLTGRDIRIVTFELPLISDTPHPFKMVGVVCVHQVMIM